MATDEVKTILEETLKRNRGPFGITALIVSLSILVLKLPTDYVTKLRETWFIIAIPATIVLLGGFGQAYLIEQKHRTRVEEKIYSQLNKLAEQFERLFANHLDDRMYFDTQLQVFADRLDALDEGVRKIFWILEKRKEYVHKGDTDRFTVPQQKKGE